MQLLFKIIKALKDPHLEKNEWILIAEIYSKLENKNFSAFENEFLKHRATSGHIAEFMRHGFAIIEDLRELNSYIDTQATNDDRLLIMTALLPDDVAFLQMAVQKIEWLSRISLQHTETNDLLRHLLHAVTYKIRQHINEPTSPRHCSMGQEQFQAVLENIYKGMLLKELRLFCIEYINSIIANVELYVKNDKLCLLYYSMGGKKIHIPSLIKSEIQAIRWDAPMVQPSPLIHLLFKKFALMDDLIHILKGTIKYPDGDSLRIVKDAPYDERLLAFAASFEDYVETFKMRIYDYTYTFFGTSYTNEPLEDDFIKTCTAHAKKIQELAINHKI